MAAFTEMPGRPNLWTQQQLDAIKRRGIPFHPQHTHNTHTENTDISRSGSGPKDDPPQLGPDLSDPDGGGGLGSFTANTEEKD